MFSKIKLEVDSAEVTSDLNSDTFYSYYLVFRVFIKAARLIGLLKVGNTAIVFISEKTCNNDEHARIIG